MAVPDITVIVGIAVAVLVEERRVVETRMGSDRERKNADLAFEADLIGVDARRPDIREHRAAG